MDAKELSYLIIGTLALLASSTNSYTISFEDGEFVIKEEDSFNDIDEARNDLYEIINLSNIIIMAPFTCIRDFVIKKQRCF